MNVSVRFASLPLAFVALVSLALVGCSLSRPSPSTVPADPTQAATTLDRVVGSCAETPLDERAADLAPPPDVEAQPIPDDPNVQSVAVVEIGELPLTDGRVFLDDVFAVGPESFNVETRAEPGRYPVCGRVARYGDMGDGIAFVEVRLSDEPVHRWRELAGGFGVDGGTGAVANAEATDTRQALSLAELEAHFDGVLARLDEAAQQQRSYYTESLAAGAVLVVFATGFGDGGYPVYVAEDADGRPVSVVADFLLLPWERLFAVND